MSSDKNGDERTGKEEPYVGFATGSSKEVQSSFQSGKEPQMACSGGVRLKELVTLPDALSSLLDAFTIDNIRRFVDPNNADEPPFKRGSPSSTADVIWPIPTSLGSDLETLDVECTNFLRDNPDDPLLVDALFNQFTKLWGWFQLSLPPVCRSKADGTAIRFSC